jgi:excisionase family DNA binding protein
VYLVDERLYTVKEAAKFLNCSTDVIREMIWAKRIGYVDLNAGGKYIRARFTQKHLNDFLKRNEVRAG